MDPQPHALLVSAIRRATVDQVARHPVVAVLVWFFTVGQALAFAPLYLDLGVAPQWFVVASTAIGLLLPTVVVTGVVDGADGLRDLRRRVTTPRGPWQVLAVGIVAMPLVAMALAVALLGRPSVPGSVVLTALAGGLASTLIVGFGLTNLWEEVAWMGFVQARLQHRHGPMAAAAITAPLFALQHTALAIGENGPVFAVVALSLLAVLSVPFRALMGWVYNAAGGNLFLVGLVHALSNAVGPGSGFGAGYLRLLYPMDATLVGVLHIIAVAVVGVAVIVATRGQLGLVRPGHHPGGAPHPAEPPDRDVHALAQDTSVATGLSSSPVQ